MLDDCFDFVVHPLDGITGGAVAFKPIEDGVGQMALNVERVGQWRRRVVSRTRQAGCIRGWSGCSSTNVFGH